VSFTPQIGGEAARPQQAMLMAVSKASGGLAAYAVAKAKKDGSHTASLSTAAIEKQIANVVSVGWQQNAECSTTPPSSMAETNSQQSNHTPVLSCAWPPCCCRVVSLS
jgi:hypothetical protein